MRSSTATRVVGKITGRYIASTAQIPQNFDAIQLRQIDIQDNQISAFLGQEHIGRNAITMQINGMA